MHILSFQAQKSRFIKLMLTYLSLLLAIFLFRCYFSASNGVKLIVHVNNSKHGTLIYQQLNGGSRFFGHTAGELYLKPASFMESVLLVTVADKGIDLLSIIQMALVGYIAVRIFKSSSTGIYLSDGLISGLFKFISGIIILNIALSFARMLLSGYYVHHVTHGQFSSNYDYDPISAGLLLFPIFIFLMQIPQRGVELQKEAELTI